MNVWYVNSILGTFRLEEEDNAICGLALCPDGVPELEPLPRKVCETPLLQEAEEQLNEYFAGARREFDLPLAPRPAPTASWPLPLAGPLPAGPWAGPATATPSPSFSPATGRWAAAAA